MLLTGGQEKKVRLFDLSRPDADPVYIGKNEDNAHDGTIKSVLWVDDSGGVSGGDDGFIKFVIHSTVMKVLIGLQMVGSQKRDFDTFLGSRFSDHFVRIISFSFYSDSYSRKESLRHTLCTRGCADA